MRAAIFLFLCSWTVACVEAPPQRDDPVQDGGRKFGAGPGTDLGRTRPDSGLDGRVDPAAKDAAPPNPADSAVEMADAAPRPPTPTPNHDQVTIVWGDEITYIAWASEGEIKLRSFGADDAPLLTTVVATDQADAVVFGEISQQGQALVGWSAGGSTFVFDPAQPQAVRRFEDVVGARMAGARDAIILYGERAGHLWLARLPDQNLEDALVRETRLPVPSTLIANGTPAVAYFAEDGQCLTIDSELTVTASMPCPISNGVAVGDGWTYAMLLATGPQDTELLVAPIVGGQTLDPVPVFTAIAGWQHLPKPGEFLPAVGRRVNEQDLTLSFIGARTGFSTRSWTEWPFAEGRAPRLDAARERAALADFSAGSEPQLVWLDVSADPLLEPWQGNVNAIRQLVAERCNEFDNDRDGRDDNGLCCAQGARFNDWWRAGTEADPRQLLLADVNRGDAHVIAVRAAESRWQLYKAGRDTAGQLVPMSTCSVEADNCYMGWTCDRETLRCRSVNTGRYTWPSAIDGAFEGHYLVTMGGFVALVADNEAGVPSLFWHHKWSGVFTRWEYDRLDLTHAWLPVKPAAPIPCDEVLAVDKLTSDLERTSIVVVCSDRILRMYADPRFEDEVYPFEHPAAQWATIGRSAPDQAQILVHYNAADCGADCDAAGAGLASYLYLPERGAPQPFFVPAALSRLPADALVDPIWQSTTPGRAAVQLSPDGTGRALRLANGQPRAEELTTGVIFDQLRYAKGARMLVGSVTDDSGLTEFYVVDTSGTGGYDLWSVRPTLTVEGVQSWQLTPGNNLEQLVIFGRSQLGRWQMQTHTFECQPR